jgi:cellobiose phosphorylase
MNKLLIILTLTSLITQACTGQPPSGNEGYLQSNLGYWDKDGDGLPFFTYTADLPYRQQDRAQNPVALAEDPAFILGNYMFTMYPTASGKYQLLATQRALGRMNQGDEAVAGENGAFVVMPGNDTTALTGMNSPLLNESTRSFGVGYARYAYNLPDGLGVERTLAVKPSPQPNEGVPGFLLTVNFKNNGKQPLNFTHHEYIRAAYTDILAMFEADWEKKDKSKIRISYAPEVRIKEGKAVKADFKPVFADNDITNKLVHEPSEFELHPPALFVSSAEAGQQVQFSSFSSRNAQNLMARQAITLQPGEEKHLKLIIGMSYDTPDEAMEEYFQESSGMATTFGQEWKSVLPSFPEADTSVAYSQELIWHAYNLEAMAMYNRYFGETKIPQNTAYTTYWGRHSNARDHMQHILPLLYYNKPLAKSAMRYMMKRHLPTGEIVVIEKGYGIQTNEWLKTSDQQLYFFWLLAEYLRVTGDYDFLDEELPYYPFDSGQKGTVTERVGNALAYLQDSVGTGEHGVIKFRRHDWNDSGERGLIQYYSHEEINAEAESYLNTAMAAAVMPGLVEQLRVAAAGVPEDKQRSLADIIESLTGFSEKQKDIVVQILQKRPFLPRLQLHETVMGDSNMYLAPQGFALMIPDLELSVRKALLAEVDERLAQGEVMGARNLEISDISQSNQRPAGSSAFGGFWYALNAPLVLGAIELDPSYAQNLLYKMSMVNFTRHFPDYWLGQWTQFPNTESSLMRATEGLPPDGWIIYKFPGFSAHPHSWMLYCHYMLKDQQNKRE